MRTTNTLTPIPIAPAIPAILEAMGLIGAGAAASEASDSESNSFTIPDMPPTEWDLVWKPLLKAGANIVSNELSEAGDFLGSIPDAYGRRMRRFLTISSPRPVPVEEVKPTYMHAGWNRVNGGYRYYDPTLGRTTETYIDPVVIEGTYTSPYNSTASLRVDPTVKMTPLVNTYQRPMPIELSSGQVVVLPTDLTDYRVFDESEDASGDTVVIDDSEDTGAGGGAGAGTGAGAGVGVGVGAGGGSPQRNDDDDDDNQISSVEEYIRRFGKDMSRQTARRLRKSERVSHDANGNINHRATRLLNRGVNRGAKSGGFNWKDFGFGISIGVGSTLGGQAIFGGEEEANPDIHGDVTYNERAKSAIDQVVEGDTTVSTKRDSLKTESAPIKGDSIKWDKVRW